TIQTANGSGSGTGFIRVVDPILWGSSFELSLQADNGITINGSITGGPGSTLGLHALGGNITQGPSANIVVPNLFAKADTGSVTLTNPGNSVTTLAGFATAAPGFSFVNLGPLDIGMVSTVFGVGHGVVTTNQPVNLSTSSGDLTISDTLSGVDAGSGSVSLAAAAGSVTQGATAPITAGNLGVTAANAITLTGVNSSGSVTATGGSINILGSINAAANVDLHATAGDLTLGIPIVGPGADIQANGNVTITANQPGASVLINSSVNWHAGGVFKIQAGKDVKFEAGIDPTLLGDAGVTIQAGSGDVDFGGFAAITTVQSPIGVTAGGN